MPEYEPRLDIDSSEYDPYFAASVYRRNKAQGLGGVNFHHSAEDFGLTAEDLEEDPPLSGGLSPSGDPDGGFDPQARARQLRTKRY